MPHSARWRHQMEIFSALLAICAGNSPVSGEFAAQRPVTRSFDIFFDLRPNKRLSKQSWGWWFETLSFPLWRQCNRPALDNISIAVLELCRIFTKYIRLPKEISSKRITRWLIEKLVPQCWYQLSIMKHLLIYLFRNIYIYIWYCIVEAWEWTNDFIPRLTRHVITYQCWD